LVGAVCHRFAARCRWLHLHAGLGDYCRGQCGDGADRRSRGTCPTRRETEAGFCVHFVLLGGLHALESNQRALGKAGGALNNLYI